MIAFGIACALAIGAGLLHMLGHLQFLKLALKPQVGDVLHALSWHFTVSWVGIGLIGLVWRNVPRSVRLAYAAFFLAELSLYLFYALQTPTIASLLCLAAVGVSLRPPAPVREARASENAA